MDKEIIYKTETPFFKYTFPAIFLVATIIAYFLKANLYVVGVLGLFFVSASFKDYLCITVYKESFTISYTNCYGNFMAIENEFYFKDVSSFGFSTLKSDLNATKIALMVAVDATLPGGRMRLLKDPTTYVSIKTKNPLGEIETNDIELQFSGETYKKALELIKKKCKSADTSPSSALAG